MSDAPPSARPVSPAHRRLRSAVGWTAAIVAVVGAGWLVVALAPRQPRPFLVEDAQAPSSSACGSFGEPAPPAPEGGDAYVPCVLPDGFTLLSDAPNSGAGQGDTEVSYVVYYTRDAGEGTPDSITVLTLVSVQAPSPTNETLRRGGADVPAQFDELDDGSLQLRWQERPGVNVRIVARGAVTREELRATATSLVPR